MNDPRQKLQILDERVESRVKAIRADRDWWPCRRGCDYCCRHLACPPELSHEEWVRIEDAIALLATPIRTEIEQKVAALLVQIAEDTVGQHVVCPYLDDSSGSCLIYDARPIACRTYGFFVARNHNQYCHIIETEVSLRSDDEIVWGNAEAIGDALGRIGGPPIPFQVYYGGKEPQMDADKRR